MIAGGSKVRWSDVPSFVVLDWFGEGLMFVFGNRGNVNIRTAVQKLVIGSHTFPQIGLQIDDRFLKPQRLVVVGSGPLPAIASLRACFQYVEEYCEL